MEFKLLRIFTSRAGRVVDRAELAKVIGVRSVEVSRALDISVSRLRKKLRDSGYDVNLRSVRGSGYLFSSDQIVLPEPDEDFMASEMASLN
jgi:DNA-binding response OmpR family regulator